MICLFTPKAALRTNQNVNQNIYHRPPMNLSQVKYQLKVIIKLQGEAGGLQENSSEARGSIRQHIVARGSKRSRNGTRDSTRRCRGGRQQGGTNTNANSSNIENTTVHVEKKKVHSFDIKDDMNTFPFAEVGVLETKMKDNATVLDFLELYLTGHVIYLIVTKMFC